MVSGGALIALLAPWAYLAVRGLELGYGVGLGGLLYPLIVMSIYFLRPPLSCLKVIAHLTVATALISIAMAVLQPSSAIYTAPTGAEVVAAKQILPWGMLEGFLTQPNNLGQLLLLGLPMVLLLRAGPLRYFYVAVIGFSLVWTASRSSIIGAGICLLVAALSVAAGKYSPTARKAVSVMCTLAMTAVLVALPLATSDLTAFSNRGYIWKVSLNAWSGSPWFGLGADWYEIVATTSEGLGGSVFHGHNQFVQTLVTGGVALAFLMALLLLALTRAAARWGAHRSVFGTVYLIALLGSCWLEVSIVFVRSSALLGVTALPLAVLVLAPNGGDDGSEHTAAVSVGSQLTPAQSQRR